MKLLIQDPRVAKTLTCADLELYRDVTSRYGTTSNGELRLNCVNRNYNHLKYNMKHSKTCQPEAYQNSALCIACETGDVRFVKRLLKDPKVNPSDDKNWPLRIAYYKGYGGIVKLLLKDSRFSFVPSETKYNYVKNAYTYNQFEIVKILLQDERMLNSLTEAELNYYLNAVTK